MSNGECVAKYIKKSVYKTCGSCFGLGCIETSRGDVIDCKNPKCENGYVKDEILIETENQDSLFH